MRSWPAMLMVAVLAGCGDVDRRPAAAAIASTEHGFTAHVPAGWHVAAESLTPNLTNPVEILSAGTASGARPRDGACAHMPVGALERIGPRDAFVTVQERFGDAGMPARPAHLTLSGGVEHGDAATCARGEAALEEYWFGFRDANRSFHVLVAFGPEAPAERRQEALALLDSLRFEPGPQGVRLDPDATVRFEDAGARLAWQLPVPPWRRYEWPLTSAQRERLVLGTFPLERGPPDGNCTPAAALEAMPDDGAFIYVFEYVDLAERWMKRIPERRAQLSLGPKAAFECMGESRMVTWKERGRAFQAHVYVGPRASDDLERDARSILNSIVVR